MEILWSIFSILVLIFGSAALVLATWMVLGVLVNRIKKAFKKGGKHE